MPWAASAGSSFARARLGSLAELAGDALGAEIAWREAARAGHHLAMFALGETLLGGGGDARARRVARAWLELASHGGVAEAAEALEEDGGGAS